MSDDDLSLRCENGHKLKILDVDVSSRVWSPYEVNIDVTLRAEPCKQCERVTITFVKVEP